MEHIRAKPKRENLIRANVIRSVVREIVVAAVEEINCNTRVIRRRKKKGEMEVLKTRTKPNEMAKFGVCGAYN